MSRFSIQAGPLDHGRGAFPGKRGFFGFQHGFYPGDFGYLILPPYPYVLLDPEVEANQEIPWDTDRYAESESRGEEYWLIALRNDTIILAADYELEGSALNYVSRSGDEGFVELSQVDLHLTRDLNRGRRREFRLPRP